MRIKVQEIPKIKKIHSILIKSLRRGKSPVTRTFANQLAETQIEIAIGVKGQDEGNNSGVNIHGTGPSPTAKQNTKEIKKKGADEGKMKKDPAREIKLKAEPETLNNVTERLPVRLSKTMATNVIAKLIKANKIGVQE